MDYIKKSTNSFQIHKKIGSDFSLKFYFCLPFGINWSSLLLFEMNILDVFKVEIVIESNLWLGMYVVYNLKWSLYPKIDENQCLPFIVNFKEINNATILTFSDIIHYCFTSI